MRADGLVLLGGEKKQGDGAQPVAAKEEAFLAKQPETGNVTLPRACQLPSKRKTARLRDTSTEPPRPLRQSYDTSEAARDV